MTKATTSEVLSGPELAALCQIMGLPEMLLPEDPFRGWLVEEIQEAVSAAADSLVSRQLLRVEGEKVWVEPGLSALAGLLAFPQMTIRIKAGEGTTSEQESVVYARAEAWAILRSTEEGYILEGGEDFLELEGQLRDRVVGSDPVSRRQPLFHIPECAVSVLQDAWKGAGPGTDRDALVKSGMPPRSVEILERLLPGVEFGSLMIESRQTGRHVPVGGAVMVEHENGMSMLLLDTRDEEAVWQAWNARAFRYWLIHMLGRMLPES